MVISYHEMCNLPEEIYICGTSQLDSVSFTNDVDGKYTSNSEKNVFTREDSEFKLVFNQFTEPKSWSIRPQFAPVTFFRKERTDLWGTELWTGKTFDENLRS